MASFLCGPSPGIYNTTKFAVRGMSESLRYSLAPHGIGVSVLCPGLVKSHIFASDDVRPDALKAGAKPVNTEMVGRLEQVHQVGMEPDVIAARVLEGMRANRFHIFSHPEFKDELQEVFDETIAAFRDYPADPGYEQRLGFEKGRRDGYKAARAGNLGEGCRTQPLPFRSGVIQPGRDCPRQSTSNHAGGRFSRIGLPHVLKGRGLAGSDNLPH